MATRTAATKAQQAKTTRQSRQEDVPKTVRSRTATVEAPKPTRRAKQVSDTTEIVLSSSALPTVSGFNPYLDLDAVLDGIEKHIGLTDSSLATGELRLSTGMLALDIVLGGGITAGWYTNFGQEQTCKTTDAVMMLASAINANIPIIYYFDFEGSATPEYVESIMRNMGVKADVKSIFGIRDEKTGKWLVPPRVRYKSEAIAERFFDAIAQIQRKLPDKKRIGDSWYYIYDGKTADGKIHKANKALVGSAYDVKYFQKTGNYRIPAQDGSLQAIVLVDSYPAMLPEKQDVDDPNSAIASQARMFSEQLRRVKGKMRPKRMAVLGINQLRLKPMVMMGNPEYEPCGEALKLFSDARLKHSARALSAISKVIGETVTGNGQIEAEPSVTVPGGVDNYRYINVRAHKNKLSRPYLEAWLRLWITDGRGQAQGFDPVFDTFIYLKTTGQLVGKRKKMLLQFKGNLATKYIGWLDFKRLILGNRDAVKAVCEKAGMKLVKLREKCFAQLASGDGITLFNLEEVAARTRKTEKSAASVAASGDDDNE